MTRIRKTIKNFICNAIRDENRLKILVISMLVLLQSGIFIGAAMDRVPSVGIIGGADGPTKIILSGGEGSGLLEWLLRAIADNGGEAGEPTGEGPAGQGAESEPDEPGFQEGAESERPSLPDATENQKQEAFERGLLILINKENPVEKDYKPEDLTPIKYFAPNRSEAGRYMREEAAEQFHKLVEAAVAQGHELVMTTAYRSYGFQEILWNNYVATEGEAAASRFSAKPGRSEHQSGLAVDVSAPSVDFALTDSFGKTEEGIWLAENAYRFGFIIRFPEGKEDVTGYLYEPWHIRYVGEPVAAEIYAKDLTLEEYLALYESNPSE